MATQHSHTYKEHPLWVQFIFLVAGIAFLFWVSSAPLIDGSEGSAVEIKYDTEVEE